MFSLISSFLSSLISHLESSSTSILFYSILYSPSSFLFSCLLLYLLSHLISFLSLLIFSPIFSLLPPSLSLPPLTPSLSQVAGVVMSLGEVPWDRPAYVQPDYLYPIGYRVLRLYPTDQSRLILEMSIADGGDRPLFRVRALDRPDEFFQGRVSSTPLVELMKSRSTKTRTISGPRMMYLDDAMVRAALHTLAMNQFEQGRIPSLYRHMHAFYGVHCLR